MELSLIGATDCFLNSLNHRRVEGGLKTGHLQRMDLTDAPWAIPDPKFQLKRRVYGV